MPGNLLLGLFIDIQIWIFYFALSKCSLLIYLYIDEGSLEVKYLDLWLDSTVLRILKWYWPPYQKDSKEQGAISDHYKLMCSSLVSINLSV